MTQTSVQHRGLRQLKNCSLICLGLLALFILSQLLSIYETKHELASPLIPKSVIREINEQYLFHAVVSFVMLLIAVGVYLLKRYWWAILLVAITLIGNRYLYW
ncbi:MAG TPA: hypothetical protein VG605_20510 [Puia sp.]|nr:hypothetical protein [Puia sp.]